MTGVLIEEEMWTETQTEGKPGEETWGKDSLLQAKERCLKQILPSLLSEGSNTAHTMILKF